MVFVAFANLSIENATNTTEQINTAVQKTANCSWCFAKPIDIYVLEMHCRCYWLGFSQYGKEESLLCFSFLLSCLFRPKGLLYKKYVCVFVCSLQSNGDPIRV